MIRILQGDCRDLLRKMPAQSVHCVVTSPPYFGLRSYLPADHPDKAREMGAEPTPAEFVAALVEVFREVRRVLRDDGTVWLNLGDSYASGGRKSRDADDKLPARGSEIRPLDGAKPKDLLGIPWRVALALQDDGWFLRQDIIWHKPNPMPESVRDRCTKAHEYIFLLSKSAKYYWDAEAAKEPAVYPAGTKGAKGSAGRAAQPGVNARPPEYKIYDGTRNRRSVWTVTTKPFSGAHFATFPPDLIEPCIAIGAPEKCCSACGAGRVRTTKRSSALDASRPQAVRAMQLAAEARLTDAHFDAIRSAGITDAGKAQATQSGTGKNAEAILALAAEAKAALGGYYREFLLAPKVAEGWTPSCDCNAPDALSTVLDPFGGAGTTALAARKLNRKSILLELNPESVTLAEQRLGLTDEDIV